MSSNDQELSTQELSTLALDVYWASGRVHDAAIDRHVGGCARCRTYLQGLDAIEASTRAAPVPPMPVSRSATEAIAFGAKAPARGGRFAVYGAAAVAASLAVIAVVTRATVFVDRPTVAAKGAPAVQLLLRRGTATRVWDGRTPLRPGDALALRVACEAARHVSVASSSLPGWKLLSQVDCPAQGELLPFTLVVDAEPGDEKLAVVLSRDTMDEQRVRQAIGGRRTVDSWTMEFVLPKETDFVLPKETDR